MARHPAFAFSTFGTFVWGIISIATLLGHKSTYGNWAFLSVVIFAVISYGVLKMRRDAAVAYLLVSIIGVGFAWGSAKLIGEIAGVFAALLSVRGTFSYSHLCARNEQKPTSNKEEAPA